MDIDFEFILAEDRDAFTAFVRRKSAKYTSVAIKIAGMVERRRK